MSIPYPPKYPAPRIHKGANWGKQVPTVTWHGGQTGTIRYEYLAAKNIDRLQEILQSIENSRG